MHVAKLTLFIWSSAHYRACGGSMSQSGVYIIGSRVFEWVMWTKITNYSGKHRFFIHDLRRGPNLRRPRHPRGPSLFTLPRPLLPLLHGHPTPTFRPSVPFSSFFTDTFPPRNVLPHVSPFRPPRSSRPPRSFPSFSRKHPRNRPAAPLRGPAPPRPTVPPLVPRCAFYIYVSKNYAKI